MRLSLVNRLAAGRPSCVVRPMGLRSAAAEAQSPFEPGSIGTLGKRLSGYGSRGMVRRGGGHCRRRGRAAATHLYAGVEQPRHRASTAKGANGENRPTTVDARGDHAAQAAPDSAHHSVIQPVPLDNTRTPPIDAREPPPTAAARNREPPIFSRTLFLHYNFAR